MAVALRFDFPARAQMQPRPLRRSSDLLDAESELGLTDVATTSAADMALAGEAQAELQTEAGTSLMESEEFEVQMVILFYRQPTLATQSGGSTGNSFGNAAFDYDAEFPLGNPAAGSLANELPLTEFSDSSGQAGPSGSRQAEQPNLEQRDGF